MLKTHKYAMYLVCATFRFLFFIFLNERFYGAGNFYKDLFSVTFNLVYIRI